MDTIEQAAKRLEELRLAGVDVAKTGDPAAQHASPGQTRAGAPAVGHTRVAAAPTDSASALPVALDLERMAAAGIITPDAARSQIADEFRVIKRPLIVNATRSGPGAIKNGNLIIITSALPGEGKSFTAINLAMSIAMELDHTVLLVDADVARPSIPSTLGIPPAPGLLDLLVDDSLNLGDLLIKTNVEKLSVLLSGTQHPRATELLASDAMENLLAEMAQRYSDRIIIFDSPPLLVTTEARELAAHMGQVVLVVHAGHTAQSDVKQALATIESSPVKTMVLNKARAREHSGYGYGYGYGYRYAGRS